MNRRWTMLDLKWWQYLISSFKLGELKLHYRIGLNKNNNIHNSDITAFWSIRRFLVHELKHYILNQTLLTNTIIVCFIIKVMVRVTWMSNAFILTLHRVENELVENIYTSTIYIYDHELLNNKFTTSYHTLVWSYIH